MVRHYGYDKAPKTALTEIRAVLESEEYKIIEFAPEDGFMITDYKFKSVKDIKINHINQVTTWIFNLNKINFINHMYKININSC